MKKRDDSAPQAGAASGLHRTALWSIAVFWAFYFLIITLRAAIIGFEHQDVMAVRRVPIALLGILISYIIYRVLRALGNLSFWRRVAVAAFLALPASLTFSAINYTAFYVLDPIEEKMLKDEEKMTTMAAVADGATYWIFFFYSWSALYLAIAYSFEVRDQERRASQFQAQAHGAQLRALRYQINPHFLFNTLNSISSLILRNRNDEAERMVLHLSTFFRSSLATDPTDDVRLADEIALQRLYLDIERVRFPERLTIDIDVPDTVADARVPSLILQPIVENAIKYGVSRSSGRVTLSIRAREIGGRLHLLVEDDGTVPASATGHGTGVGLRNVCQRLTARFGDSATCHFGPVGVGGFRVELIMPLLRNG